MKLLQIQRLALLLLTIVPASFRAQEPAAVRPHQLPAAPDPFAAYGHRKFIQSGDTLPYRVLLPENYDPAKAYPLVIFLHGRGESGNDNRSQLMNGGSLFLRDSIRKGFPAIVVFPQCGARSYWSNVQTVGDSQNHRTFYFIPDGEASVAMRLLTGLADNLFRQYAIKQDQVYAMGLSMGGMGTFELVRRMPRTFAGAIAICGGADPATAGAIRSTAWWIFHGALDDVVLPEYSIRMVEALKKRGNQAKFTLFPEANHNSWDGAFNEPGVINWLFSQRRK